jgi:hypothetical protein
MLSPFINLLHKLVSRISLFLSDLPDMLSAFSEFLCGLRRADSVFFKISIEVHDQHLTKSKTFCQTISYYK